MKCTHNLQENVLGTVVWEQPIQINVVWAKDDWTAFSNIVRLEVMKTGCYVLHARGGEVFILPPGYRYLVEHEMPL